MVASGEGLGPFLSTSRRSPDVSRIGFYSDPYSLRRVTTKTILFAELLPEEQNCLDPILIRLDAEAAPPIFVCISFISVGNARNLH